MWTTYSGTKASPWHDVVCEVPPHSQYAFLKEVPELQAMLGRRAQEHQPHSLDEGIGRSGLVQLLRWVHVSPPALPKTALPWPAAVRDGPERCKEIKARAAAYQHSVCPPACVRMGG